MALGNLSPLFPEISGRIGDLIVARHKPGLEIIRHRPTRTAPPTVPELGNQARFKLAVTYAKALWKEQPELKAKYIAAAQLKHRLGFNLAKGDFLNPPRVEEIDLDGYSGKTGEVIRVSAVDDFGVKS